MINNVIQHGGRGRPSVAFGLAFTALVLATMLLVGCDEPLAPMIPEWDIDTHLPLINQTYSMADMLSEGDMLRIASNGESVVVVTQRQQLRAFCFADQLRLDDRQHSSSGKLDMLHFDIPDYMDQALDIFTLFPELPRNRQIVPALRNGLGLTVDIDAHSYFEEMTFEKGFLVLTFTNKTPVPLRLEQTTLLNSKGEAIASSSSNDLVLPGKSVTPPAISLAGLTLHSRMRLGFIVSTPGSNGVPVDLNSSHYLGIVASINNSDIFSVKGYVPPQEVQFSDNVDLTGNSGMRVKNATVHSGTLTYIIKNNFDLAATATISLPGVSIGGNPVSTKANLAAKENSTFTIDLAGATLTPLNESRLVFETVLHTEDAREKAVLMKKSDSISISVALKNLCFAEITGRLPTRTLHVRKMEASTFANDKNITGSVTLSEASMWAELHNKAQLPVSLVEANILGKRSNGASSVLQVQPFSIAPQSQHVIRFDNASALHFLNSFSPELPDSLGLEGTFTINAEGRSGSALASDSVIGDLFVEFPLRFTQVSGSIIDTVEMIIDADSRKKLNEVNEGLLTIDIENHLPTRVTIEPEFLDSRYRLLLSAGTVDGSAITARSAVTGTDGFVAKASVEKLKLHFTGDDFATISKAAYIRFRLTFNTDESSASAFRSTDYVRIRGYAQLNISTAITGK